ncbi:MAG TPA: hypothetical protein VFT84_07915 [Gemmatimonadales bacterium]|nr:hypothetical protein [Gemmatimonadales bacterium]
MAPAPVGEGAVQGRPSRAAPIVVAGVAILIACLGAVGEVRSPLNGDAAWLLWVGGKVLGGARPYVDVLEVNPPLVIWLSAASVAVSRALHLDPIAGYRVLVGALVCGSLVAAWLVLRGDARGGPARTRAVLLALLTALAAMPAVYFGEREHLALALVVPLLCAVSLAPVGGGTPGRVQLAVGAMAGVGLAIKPHFVLLWLPLVAYEWRRDGAIARRLHGPVLAILAVYPVAVLSLTPEYLPMLSLLGADYQRFSAREWGEILTRDTLPLSVLLALGIYAGARRTLGEPRLADVLAVATGGGLLAVLLQGKGFGYHWLLPIGTSVLLLAAMLADPGAPTALGRAGRTGLGWLGLAACLWPFLGATVRRAGGELSPIDRWTMDAARYLQSEAPGQPVGVLSGRLADAFPLMLYAGAEWPFRFPHLWFVSVYRGDGVGRRPAEGWTRRVVAEDLARRRPALLLVREYRPDAPADVRDDLVAFLSRDSLFARAFGEYRRSDRLGDLTVYRRVGPAAGDAASGDR